MYITDIDNRPNLDDSLQSLSPQYLGVVGDKIMVTPEPYIGLYVHSIGREEWKFGLRVLLTKLGQFIPTGMNSYNREDR